MQGSSELLERADVLSEDELDALPVGMIQLSPDGTVLKFNHTESQLARYDKENALGKNFFDEVAPCTKVQTFYGRFLQGIEQQNLHTVFPYEFKFRDGQRKDVIISMFYSKTTATVWVQVQRP